MKDDNIFLWVKAVIAAACGAFTAAFGWLGWLVVAWAACMVLDWLSGSAAAASRGEWSSAVARSGIWHKAGMLVVVIVAALTDAGLRMAVLSNKPDPFTKIMVPALLPGWNFEPILGARPGVPVKPDPQAALEIAGQLAVPPHEILYLGDTATDMRTANAAGMMAIGVAWGFRPIEELQQHGAQRIIHYPTDLLPLLQA